MQYLKAWAALTGLALTGACSLLLLANRIASLPDEVVQQIGGARVLAILSIIQPTILAAVAAAVGLATAHRAGLRSVVVDRIRGRQSDNGQRVLPLALGCGLSAGLLIVIGDLLLSPWTDAALSRLSVPAGDRLEALAVGVLYGGLTEEILLRWGLMSLLAWLLTKAGVRTGAAVGSALLIAALVFAAAHLPALAATTELDLALAVRTILLNTGTGILFGVAFARHGLEAAMRRTPLRTL